MVSVGRKVIAHLSLLTCGAIIGGWNIVAKETVKSVSTIYFTLLRQIGSAISLMFIAKFIERSNVRIQNRKQLCDVICSGLLMCGVNLCFIIGNKLTDPSVTAVFQAFTPIDGVFIGALSGLESLTCLKLFGSSLASGGTALYGYSQMENHFSVKTMIGYGVLFAEGIFNAVFCVFLKRLMVNYSPIGAVAWANMVCICICSLTLLAVWYFELEEGIGVMNTTLAIGLAYATFAVTGFAYVLKAVGNKSLPVSVVCLYDPSQIFFTVLLNYLIYSKLISWKQAIGVAMVISGMILVNLFRNTDEDDEEYEELRQSRGSLKEDIMKNSINSKQSELLQQETSPVFCCCCEQTVPYSDIE